MKLLFLGSGSAFTLGADNFQSNMLLISDNDEKLLIDCGSDARWSLTSEGYSYKDITNVYISHLHADHVGGLEWLAFCRYFDPECKKPNLYIAESLISDLWNKVLAGGLSSLEGEVADLSTFFNVRPIADNSYFTWGGVEIRLVQTVHVMSGYSISKSFGLIFNYNDKTIFITTDTQFCPSQIHQFYHMADIIFHDCETSGRKSCVHARFEELTTLESTIKGKIWLYHYNPGKLPDAKKEGFKGFVKKGQIFNFNDLKTL